jgi:hypothetical protein
LAARHEGEEKCLKNCDVELREVRYHMGDKRHTWEVTLNHILWTRHKMYSAAQGRVQWQAFINMVINIWVS